MYTPLIFCKNMDANELSEKLQLRFILESSLRNPDETLVFLQCDNDFLNPQYDGKFADLNKYLIQNRRLLIKSAFGDIPDIIKPRSEMDMDMIRDCIIPYIVVNKWGENKQVYKFDAELELELSDMEEVKLPVRILDRLPFRSIYIDFADNGIYKSHFSGCFVHVAKYEVGYVLFFLRVMDDGKMMRGSVPLIPNDNSADAVFLINQKEDISCDNVPSHYDWKEFGIFVLNALLYLCADNAKITESETTKNTYRPGKRIRHKFSEVRIWDCEYVYGPDVVSKPESSECLELSERENNSTANVKKTTHTVRPHMRRAHWHHYWIGEGRKELVLRWVSATRVGSQNPIATIRNVL